MWACHAERLRDLLADDLIQAVMQADNVDPAVLETLMVRVGRQRRRACDDAPANAGRRPVCTAEPSIISLSLPAFQ